MDYNILKEQLKEHNIKISFLNKALYAKLSEIIPENETIQFIFEGLDRKSTNKSPAVITSKNIYIISYAGLFFGINISVIPIDKITSIKSTSSMLGLLYDIHISESTSSYSIDRVAQATAEKAIIIINRLKNAME